MLLLSLPYRLLCLALAWAVHGWQQEHQPHHQQGATRHSTRHLLLQHDRSFDGGRLDGRTSPARIGGHLFGRPARSAKPLRSSRAPSESSSSEAENASGGGGGGGDEECPSEEECEIDWDKMPGFADEEEEGEKEETKGAVQAQAHQSQRTSMASSEPSTADTTNIESTPQRKRGSKSSKSVDKAVRSVESSRLRLEMMWKLDEAVEDCEVERPETCGSRPCEVCRGRGVAPCRFCGGRRVLGFSRESGRSGGGRSVAAFYACTICDDHGMEACQACRGTGWVAEWALLTPGTYTTSSSGSAP